MDAANLDRLVILACVNRVSIGLALALGTCICMAAGTGGSLETRCHGAKLAGYFEGSQPTALAVLSPRMPYALQEWRRMSAVAERNGFRVQSMRDPRVPQQEWEQAVRSLNAVGLLNIAAIDEEVASSCGLLNHTPAVLVGLCGTVHPWPVLGVMTDESWESVLNSRLQALPEASCK